MDHVLRMLFVALVAVTGMLLNAEIQSRASTLQYMKEDLEIAVHDAALQVDSAHLSSGKVIFKEEEALNVFKQSFEKNSGLSSADYEITEIAFLDHSTVSNFPTTYTADTVDYEETFYGPTIVAFLKTSPSKYFPMSTDKPYIRGASYTYKLNTNIIGSFPNDILDIPNGQGFVWPVPHTRNLSSSYGERIHPLTGKTHLHAGIDIAAPGIKNTPAFASKGGTVIYAGPLASYGNLVVIDHGDGIETRYAHLNRIDVTTGQTVNIGQQIGLIGSTGDSSGPHLHFEIRVNGKPYNPLLFFPD